MQIAKYLSPDDPVKAYDQRESSDSIPSFPLKQERSNVWSLVAGVCLGFVLLGRILNTLAREFLVCHKHFWDRLEFSVLTSAAQHRDLWVAFIWVENSIITLFIQTRQIRLF